MQTIKDVLGRKPIHPFPARMAPSIALKALGGAGKGQKVLDPMAGSGTVLAVGRARSQRVYGFDTDPLAVLISSVWTTTVETKAVEAKAKSVLERAQRAFATTRVRDAYPNHADEETKQFVRYWFDEYARRQLTALSSAISRVRDNLIRKVLWVAFSRLIISKQSGASLAMDLSHSRPHRSFARAPSKPFRKFLEAVKIVVHNCPQKGSRNLGPPASVNIGDVRCLPLATDAVDLVITSPPYANAIDYLRCSKFSLVWMGYGIPALRAIRSEAIGTERQAKGRIDADTSPQTDEAISALGAIQDLPSALRGRLVTYVLDITQAVSEIARVTRPRGSAVFVVGDSTMRGVFIRNSGALEVIAESTGLRVINRETRTLPPNRRYLPPPTSTETESTLERRMSTEVVLTCEVRP